MLSYYILPSSSQRTLHSPVFHFISYLIVHQIQILKRKKYERFPYMYFPCFSVLYLRDTCFDLLHLSFLIIWKDLRELLLVLIIFAPQQKKQQKDKKKRYSLMIESLLSSNTSNYFKFIVTPTRRKNLWSPSQKWNTIHNFWKTKDCRQHALVNYTK